MATITQSKVVSALPNTLTADTIYYVRVSTGFDMYLTNHSGTIVSYAANGNVPTGGARNQVLTKNTANDYDYSWVTPSGDMLKGSYDTANSGSAVDNSRALGGVAASSYARNDAVNNFIDGQVVNGRLKLANPGGAQLAGAGFEGALQYYANNLYIDNGTTNLKITNQVPTGGATGQMLVKISGTDLATGWSTPFDKTIANTFAARQQFTSNLQITSTGTNIGPGFTGMLQNINNVLTYDNGTLTMPLSTMVPSGGATGQVLAKSAGTDYVTAWVTPVTAGTSSTDTGLAVYSGTTGKVLTTAMIAATSTGALQTFGVGVGTVAGNARGSGAIDLQVQRTDATQVASGDRAAILSGSANKNLGTLSAVVGGGTNTISSAITYGFIGGGSGNTLNNNYGTLSGGNSNTLGTNQTSSTIAGGYQNFMITGSSSTIGYNTISGGSTNKINQADVSYGVIGGGNTNTISGGVSGTISGGSSNTISTTGSNSVISGGNNNSITGGGSYSTIGGGTSNVIQTGYNFIGGGTTNTINGVYSVVGGGNLNSVSASYGAIAGGASNSVSGNYGFATGQYALASIFGQRAFANNRFATTGDAQMSLYNLMAATASTTAVVMTVDGSATATASNSITLANAQSKYFYINILAQSTSATSVTGVIVWEIKALIVRGANAASTVVVGTPTTTTLFSTGTVTGWAPTISTDTTLGALKISVTTGGATTAVKWLATIEGTEIIF